MRKILIPFLLLTILIGCDKKEPGGLKYVNAISGGCFVDKNSSFKGDPLFKPDTLYYSITSDSLNIFVGFNSTCCSEYSSSSFIEGDSILIKILSTQIGLCNCICYYTYNFKFSGNANFYKYHVSGSNLNFKGQIEP